MQTVTPQQIQEMDSKYIQVAALGRTFELGMLYDVCKDKMFPGKSLDDAGSTAREGISSVHFECDRQKNRLFENIFCGFFSNGYVK